MDYKQVMAIKEKNKKIIREVCPDAKELSGIYFMTREENGFKYAYVGQAKKVLSRLADHLIGYQHIDISLKKHKFYSLENPTGWKVNCLFFPQRELDEKEQYYIKLYANKGYQMRNKTAGGQGEGKFAISEERPTRGYRDGINSGYKKARQEVSKLFEKNLTYSINGEPNKNKEKAYDKFKEFINVKEE
jgi:hypothetical protein